MTRKELNNLLKLTKNDSKSISDNAKKTIFKCLIDIDKFSKKMYDSYKICLELNWLYHISLAKKIKIVNYDKTYIYIDTLFYNKSIISGHHNVIKIEDILKYSSEEFKKDFKYKLQEERLKQLNNYIESNKKIIEQYKEEIMKIKAEQNEQVKVK